MKTLRRWAAGTAAVVVLASCMTAARVNAQEPGEQGAGRGQFAGMQRVGGVVTAIAGSQVTLKGEDGATYQVVTTDNTRVMRGRGVTIKMSDIKAGDGLMAMGNLDAANKTLHAAMVISVDAAQMKQMEEQRKQAMASLGKTNIIGRVTAVDMDNAAMTVERPDGVSQTIGFDEGTSFRRGRPNFGGAGGGGGMFAMGGGGANAAQAAPADTGESITLADVKVGDRVGGPGEVKNGRFIAKQLMVMTPGAGGGRRRGAEQPGAAAAPAGTPPAPSQSPK